MDQNAEILQQIDEIIKSNYVLLSKLMNKGELSQIGDNDSGRLFYSSFDENAPLKMNWLFEIIRNLYQQSEFYQEEKQFTYEIKSTIRLLITFKRLLKKSKYLQKIIKVIVLKILVYTFGEMTIVFQH